MFDIKGYYEANELTDFYKLVRKRPQAKIIAGGTDVLIKSRQGNEEFVDTDLIGITNIRELHQVYLDEEKNLMIGALNTFTEIEEHPLIQKYAPLLSQAVALVGGPQTRHMGTIGGNICNGATSADGAPTLFAYNALLEIRSEKNCKEVPIADFYKGAGWVDLKAGEILTRIKITHENYHAYVGNYTKFAQRQALDIANLSCAVLLKEKQGKIEDLRICFGVAGPTPLRMTTAENYAKEKTISNETLNEIGQKCLADANTRDSWRASKAYRDQLITILPGRNIIDALKTKEGV